MSSVYRNRPDGKTVHRKKGKIGGPFTPLLNETMDSPAWRALSHGAVRLYIELKRRYSIDEHNNGRIHLSTREARVRLKTGFDSITRWFRELQHYGFIVQTAAGCLGVDGKGKAPHWRLTELGYMRDLPTRDFTQWNGVKFRPRKNRIPHPPSVRGAPQTGCTTAPTIGAPKGRSAPDVRCIQRTYPAPVEGAFLEEPSPHSELQGTASGGRVSAPPPRAVASEPADDKPRSDRGRIEAEIAEAIGWDELFQLPEADLNQLCEKWAAGIITADTLRAVPISAGGDWLSCRVMG